MSQNSDSSSRHKVIAGNWKMYKTIDEANAFVETLAPLIEKSQATVYLAVPFTAIYPASKRVEELKAAIMIGAQNMNDAEEGAFTGEIAARMLKDAGACFVILGHSERRHLFDETDCFINKKVKRALNDSLQPIVCIGETLAQREKGETQSVLKEQLLGSLEGVPKTAFSKLIIAYEPIWAIGTGKVAQPDDAQTAHVYIRGVIAENWGQEAADQVVIQYGGSVEPGNAAALLSQPDVNGLLVGGASRSADSFSKIINGSKA